MFLILLAVTIISMSVRFARQVSGLRRISLPKRLTEAAAIPELGFVRVELAPAGVKALRVLPAEQTAGAARRDPTRPRQLNLARQVTLPAPLMDAVALAVLEWVHVSRSPDGDGLLVEPAGML